MDCSKQSVWHPRVPVTALGLGMRVVGGKQGPDGKLGAFVTHVVMGSQADLHDICEGNTNQIEAVF